MASAVEDFLRPIPEELLIYVFSRLDSRLLAVVACVCKGWRSAACALNSSAHWYRSAMSQKLQLEDAMDELLEDVLAAPFWPDFAIVFAGEEVDLNQVSEVVKRRLPKGLPLVACNTTGMMGRDIDTGLSIENAHTNHDGEGNWNSHAVALSVGRFPGVNVKALKLRNSLSDSEVRNFVATASTLSSRGRPGHHPLAILLFADTSAEFTQTLKELDKAYGGKSAIGGGVVGLIGKRKSLLVHSNPAQLVQKTIDLSGTPGSTCHSSSTKVGRSKGVLEETIHGDTACDFVALAFTEDIRFSKNDTLSGGRLKCAVAASGILKAVGPLYKVISSRVSSSQEHIHTNITCERDGELMTAEDVAEEVVKQNHLQESGALTHIGVFRPRSRQNRPHFSLHEVLSTTDLLTISEAGVRTRDCFRFYTPCIDVDVAVESMSKTLLSMLSSDNVNDTTKIIARKAYPSMKRRPRRKIIGGLVFSGEYFWNHVFFNYCEIADFHDMFPDIPVSGVTCHCQFGPPAVLPGGTDVERESTQGNVMGNFFSTTFFLFCTD
ncbi:hypothetical protein Mapa_014614 [Marchantia paleacea]|nr:hypothetical protein Mapa_014614 [Marchantia paleacea]